MTWPIKLLRISGHSMQPVINHGQMVVVNQWVFFCRKPKNGDIVVFKQDGKLFCKRIAKFDHDNFTVRGDNVSDSLELQPIRFEQILGQIWS